MANPRKPDYARTARIIASPYLHFAPGEQRELQRLQERALWLEQQTRRGALGKLTQLSQEVEGGYR